MRAAEGFADDQRYAAVGERATAGAVAPACSSAVSSPGRRSTGPDRVERPDQLEQFRVAGGRHHPQPTAPLVGAVVLAPGQLVVQAGPLRQRSPSVAHRRRPVACSGLHIPVRVRMSSEGTRFCAPPGLSDTCQCTFPFSGSSPSCVSLKCRSRRTIVRPNSSMSCIALTPSVMPSNHLQLVVERVLVLLRGQLENRRHQDLQGRSRALCAPCLNTILSLAGRQRFFGLFLGRCRSDGPHHLPDHPLLQRRLVPATIPLFSVSAGVSTRTGTGARGGRARASLRRQAPPRTQRGGEHRTAGWCGPGCRRTRQRSRRVGRTAAEPRERLRSRVSPGGPKAVTPTGAEHATGEGRKRHRDALDVAARLGARWRSTIGDGGRLAREGNLRGHPWRSGLRRGRNTGRIGGTPCYQLDAGSGRTGGDGSTYRSGSQGPAGEPRSTPRAETLRRSCRQARQSCGAAGGTTPTRRAGESRAERKRPRRRDRPTAEITAAAVRLCAEPGRWRRDAM